MGAKSGFALKFVQWFIRGVQFCCCALTLALFSYFLASASRHNQSIPTWARAVEGISGIGVIYTAAGLLLLCCLAGHPATSFLAIVIDIAFVGAFIYVAQANRGGAGSCRGDVNTLFGEGVSNTSQNGLAEFGTICRMQSAVLAVSIVAIFFFILSAVMEFVLVRHRRKERAFGPSPGNNYTSGYAKRGGLFGIFGRKKAEPQANPNSLPMHTTPDQVRDSYATETTAVAGGHHGANGYKQSYEATAPNAYRHEPVTGGYSNDPHNGQTAYPETGVQSGVTGGQSGYRF